MWGSELCAGCVATLTDKLRVQSEAALSSWRDSATKELVFTSNFWIIWMEFWALVLVLIDINKKPAAGALIYGTVP